MERELIELLLPGSEYRRRAVAEMFEAHKEEARPVHSPQSFKEPKRCFNNAIEVMAEARLMGSEAGYVEGFVVGLFPIIHAWNILDGDWIDCTLRDPSEYDYVGMKIPNAVLVSAIADPAWSMCKGVLEVLCVGDRELFCMAQEYLLKQEYL